jgi:signal-transduction protein with cAMP-binding, CBS, and nucleotidyltransferase domain
MITPAYAVTGDRLGGEVLLDMLERGVHHVPVLSATGEVLGVVDDADLVAAEARKPFLLRRAIDQSATVQDLSAASADFIFALRLDHQVEQLRRGEAPDDFINPATLNPLARSYLRYAFRAIASVQSGLATELPLGVRWG